MKKATKFILTFIILSSCRHSLKPTEYNAYVKNTENGLVKNVVIGDWTYTFQYRPTEYIIMSESHGMGDAATMVKRRQQLDRTAWFNISFKLTDGNVSPLRYNADTKEEYDRRLNFFLNTAMENIQLVYGQKDTLVRIGYVFETNFNLTPQETMVVGFALPNGTVAPEKDMQLAYTDEIFKNGIIKIVFKGEDMNKIPNLIY